jgi:tRNA-2-methylthio-N6-dimethylallyladenosine synthase
MTKKVFVKTWGCQMNVRDSEVIAGLMRKDGYKLADRQEKADIITKSLNRQSPDL